MWRRLGPQVKALKGKVDAALREQATGNARIDALSEKVAVLDGLIATWRQKTDDAEARLDRLATAADEQTGRSGQANEEMAARLSKLENSLERLAGLVRRMERQAEADAIQSSRTAQGLLQRLAQATRPATAVRSQAPLAGSPEDRAADMDGA